MDQIIAKRYAKALYDLSNEKNCEKDVSRDMSQIQSLLIEADGLNMFFTNPVIPSEKRIKIMEAMFKTKTSKLTQTFLNFLETKKRLSLLGKIAEEYQAIYLSEKNIVKAKILSAVELNKSQVDSISKHFEKKLDKKIEAECEINPDLIGGIKLKIDDTTFDYSVETQLKDFKNNLVKA